jgi:hypothetical protein
MRDCLWWYGINYLQGSYQAGLTIDKTRSEDVRRWFDQSAFAGNADSRQRIVTSDHATCKVCLSQGLNRGSRPRLEFVLEDNQTKERQSRLGLLP